MRRYLQLLELTDRKRITRRKSGIGPEGEGVMRKSLGLLAFAAMIAVGGTALAEDLPAWAFAANPPAPKPAAPPADDGTLKHVPGSAVAMTLTQVRDAFNIPDWHPDNHLAAPDIVVHGRKPAVIACGYCHLPNGLGRPENAGLAGLPAAYIAQQIADFRSGARVSSAPNLPHSLMDTVAKAATDEEVKAAGACFSGLEAEAVDSGGRGRDRAENPCRRLHAGP